MLEGSLPEMAGICLLKQTKSNDLKDVDVTPRVSVPKKCDYSTA